MKKRNGKFNSTKTIGADGRMYHSKAERDRAIVLQGMEKNKELYHLKYQVPFPLKVKDALICKYFADFTYVKEGGEYVVEDVKGVITKEFRIKAKLFEALYGFPITLYPEKKRKVRARKTKSS